MHMKDIYLDYKYIDVANQENSAPVYFQFLSLSRLSVDEVIWMWFRENTLVFV